MYGLCLTSCLTSLVHYVTSLLGTGVGSSHHDLTYGSKALKMHQLNLLPCTQYFLELDNELILCHFCLLSLQLSLTFKFKIIEIHGSTFLVINCILHLKPSVNKFVQSKCSLIFIGTNAKMIRLMNRMGILFVKGYKRWRTKFCPWDFLKEMRKMMEDHHNPNLGY